MRRPLEEHFRSEIRSIILEFFRDDPGLNEKLKEMSMLQFEIEKTEAQLKRNRERFGQMVDEILPLLEEADDKIIETKNVLVSISKKGFPRENYSWKAAFELLYSKVNASIQKIADSAREATKTVSYISPKLSFRMREESIFGKMKVKVSAFLKSIVGRMKSYLFDADEALGEMQEMAEEL